MPRCTSRNSRVHVLYHGDIFLVGHIMDASFQGRPNWCPSCSLAVSIFIFFPDCNCIWQKWLFSNFYISASNCDKHIRWRSLSCLHLNYQLSLVLSILLSGSNLCNPSLSNARVPRKPYVKQQMDFFWSVDFAE